MRRRLYLLALLCLSFSTRSDDKHPSLPVNDTSCNVPAQALNSFERKFAVITTDIEASSRANLDRIRSALTEKREFAKYLPEAQSLRPSVDAKLKVLHETEIENAVKILETGALLSGDELARRCQEPASKFHRFTRASDRAIGEEDVVYFSIRDPVTKKNGFGPVRFTLDKESMLKLGYFTPFSFSVGSPVVTDPYRDEEQGIEKMAPLYKMFVFKGPEAFQEFLEESIAHELWREKHPYEKETKSLLGPHSDMESQQADFKRAIEDFGQSAPAADINREQMIRMGVYFYKGLNKQRDVINSYMGFPIKVPEKPLLFTHSADFWELKVPREVSLDHMREMEFPAKKSSKLIKALESYARRSGRKLTRESAPNGTIRYVIEPKR